MLESLNDGEKNKNIPILHGHDPDAAIGKVIAFKDGVVHAMLFKQALERDEKLTALMQEKLVERGRALPGETLLTESTEMGTVEYCMPEAAAIYQMPESEL